jgi:hypothetical protein
MRIIFPNFIEGGGMVINVSEGKENYSQRNNLIKPFESCNVTSMVMALEYMGYVFPKGEFGQPEDNLRTFMETNGKNPELHAELSEYTNKWMGRKVTEFSMLRTISDILSELLEGHPVVISGTFPGFPTKKAKPLGHIVCLVGAEWDNKSEWIGPPDRVIWDDPYGNTMKDWQGSGNDIKIEYKKFIEWIKPVNNTVAKWGHFFINRVCPQSNRLLRS